MVDLTTLAVDVVAYLTPFLPYLQQAGGKVAEEVGKKFGEGVWERAKALWGKVGLLASVSVLQMTMSTA